MNFIPDVNSVLVFYCAFSGGTFGLMCAQTSVRIERVSRIRSLSEVTAYRCESAGSE